MTIDRQILENLARNRERHVCDLQAFIQKPSIAAQNRGVEECVEWLVQFMRSIGVETTVDTEGGHPVILAKIEGDSPRTLLIYGHYDVQPVDESKWDYAPFGGQVADGKLFGRGAVDNKGPVMAVLEALRSWVDQGRRPPVTVKLLFEGEEEIGSPSLPAVLERHREWLRSDGLVNFDDCVWPDGRPRVVCGIKGLCMLRLTCHAKREFHAMMAPLLVNPLWRLVHALNAIASPDGTVRIPGFYDDVLPPGPADLEALESLQWTGEDLLHDSGQETFLGDRRGADALRFWLLEPNCHLQGIEGGYLPPDRKGVIPTSAVAEIRFGTVPNQTPEGVLERVRQHLSSTGYEEIEVEMFAHAPWARTPLDGRLASALQRSLEAAFNRPTARQPSYGGSGPEGVFQQLFPEMEQAYSGFGPPENVIHSPNEYILVKDYEAGIEAVARLLMEYAA